MNNYKGSKPMDPLKAAIAKYIQQDIEPLSALSLEHVQDVRVVDVEVHIISPTETIIRVKTKDKSYRYFHNKLKEMM